MNTKKLNYAMQYISDDLLMEFFRMDDKLNADRTAIRQKRLRRFVAAACLVLLATIAGMSCYIRLRNSYLEKQTTHAELELDAVPILVNDVKYQMYGDSPYARELLSAKGFPADYGTDTIGEKLGYLEMVATTADERFCFTFTAKKTNCIIYTYVNTAGDDFFILQWENYYYLIINDSIAN